MSEAGSPFGNLVAAAFVDVDGFGVGSFVGKTHGFNPTVTVPATGRVVLELGEDNHISPTNRVVILTSGLVGGVGAYITESSTLSSESLIEARTFNVSGVLINSRFWIAIFRRSVGVG